MLNHTFTWNGVASNTLGVRIQRFPNHDRPLQKFERVSVPGRNGDLFFYQEAWENYDQTYEIFAGTGVRGNVPATFADIISWLIPEPTTPTVTDYINLTVGGYHQLVDTYEPDTIRLATYCNATEIADSWTRYGQTDITFNCRPERFTADAFTMITLTSSGTTLTNPTDRKAKPFLKVYGSGDGVLRIGDYAVAITGMADYLNIDCEQQNCYRLLAENRNSLISLSNGFPALIPGSNSITWTGGITSVEITPRWWRL